mgnify:CR=1 FL=1
MPRRSENIGGEIRNWPPPARRVETTCSPIHGREPIPLDILPRASNNDSSRAWKLATVIHHTLDYHKHAYATVPATLEIERSASGDTKLTGLARS